MMRRRPPAALVLACVAIAGCQDPYTETTPTGGEPAGRHELRRAERPLGDELPPRAPAAVPVPARAEAASRARPRSALKAFCLQWADWSWRTVDRQQQRLAGLATGRLAVELAAEARQAKLDRALRGDRLAMRGRLVAVDLDPPGRPGLAVCVTREQEIRHGRAELGGGNHRVYLAALRRTARGWGVSRWQPQP
jgi:hypothetical protein